MISQDSQPCLLSFKFHFLVDSVFEDELPRGVLTKRIGWPPRLLSAAAELGPGGSGSPQHLGEAFSEAGRG